MSIALTGTPGVGKTTVSKILKKRGYDILDLNRFLKEKDLLGKKDIHRDTFEVDLERMKKVFEKENLKVDIIEGHLSHHLSVSTAVVLRCAPPVLKERMKSKGWKKEKIEENVEAEMIDAILIQAMETSEEVFEIDTTELAPSQVASSVEDIIGGKTEGYEPGTVDWSDELL